MAKKFSLKSVRVQDLKTVIDGISNQELTKFKQSDVMKNIKNVSKVVLELEEANAKFNDLMGNINLGAVEIVKPYKEAWAKKQEELKGDKEATEAASKAINDEAMVAINAYMEKQNSDPAVAAAGEEVVEVKVGSDERFALLKELFEEFAPSKINGKKPLIELSDALDAATEA
jgi:hypothetical protein